MKPILDHSLEAYARQRARLAGSALVADGHPYFKSVHELREERRARGADLVSFANYDYLGLGHDPRILEAACRAAADYGIGAGASRLVGGECALHARMEAAISAFVGMEDTVGLVSGYMTNMSLIGHLLTSNDLIVADELSHNSIIAGTELSRAQVVHFAHNDLDDLDRVLAERRPHHRRVLIVIEGLYSMDGDIPDLPGILALKSRHDAWLLVDEAHSIGVLGARGRGLAEHWGVDPNEIDLVVGTLSKSFVSAGGFVSARRSVCDWLRFTLPGFVYSVGLPPMIAASVIEAVAILEAEPWRLERLRENGRAFLHGARARGLDVGLAQGIAVVPILFEDPRACMAASMRLQEQGYYAPPIVQVAVSRAAPRIRCFVCASHTSGQIEGCLDALVEARAGIAPTPA